MAGNEFLRGKPVDAGGEQRLSFIFKLLAFAIIIAGFQAATQKFCASVGYDPGWVGAADWTVLIFGGERRVYACYKIFYWALTYIKRAEIQPYISAAMNIVVYTSLGAIAFYFILEFVIIRSRKQNIFGTARWARTGDFRKAGLLGTKGGVILGQLADAKLRCVYDTAKDSVVMRLKKPSRKLVQSGIYNTILTAPTRSGKGVSSVIPTLLCCPTSMIVLDFKGENFNLTSGFRAKFGKVYRWEPTGEKGHHFNPMAEIRPGEDAFSDANLIADILTAPAAGGENATGEHFRTGAKDLLTAVILHCLCCPEWKDKSLAGCRTFLNRIDPQNAENKKYVYDLMINGYHGDEDIHQAVVDGAGAQRSRPDDEGGSMKSTVNNALAVFADPKIKRNTQESEFYIDEFAETKIPITLYLTIQYSDVDRIQALIRMFVLLFSRRFTSGETQAANRKFKVPLLFVLDEFDKLGRMDELERNMGIHNGFGIHYFLIFQSLNQLNKIYTKDHSFLAHCRNSIFFAPGAGELESAELISKICGRESFSKADLSYSGSRGALGYNSNSISSRDQERNLINADEIIKLPLDSAILVCQGLPPGIIKKNVYYNDPLFLPRLVKEPAFTNREEAAALAAETVEKIKARQWFNLIEPEVREDEPPEEPEISDEDAEAAVQKFGGEAPEAGGDGRVLADQTLSENPF